MKVVLKKPVAQRLLDAIADAARQNQEIDRIILDVDETNELRAFMRVSSTIRSSSVNSKDSVVLFYGVTLQLTEPRSE